MVCVHVHACACVHVRACVCVCFQCVLSRGRLSQVLSVAHSLDGYFINVFFLTFHDNVSAPKQHLMKRSLKQISDNKSSFIHHLYGEQPGKLICKMHNQEPEDRVCACACAWVGIDSVNKILVFSSFFSDQNKNQVTQKLNDKRQQREEKCIIFIIVISFVPYTSCENMVLEIFRNNYI